MIPVTGATGFVGKAVAQRLLAKDDSQYVAVALRRKIQKWPARVRSRVAGDLVPAADWSDTLRGISTVVHCAARVHVMQETSGNPLTEFRRVNMQGTLNLACQAAAASVRRFIFLSTIKVNGESTQPGKPFTLDDKPAPQDPYSISKYGAEISLCQLAEKGGMEVVIVRPPLVYGPGVKANFHSMMRWLAGGVPLPLGAIHNQRSFVALGNQVDLVVTCIKHPAAANKTFLVADSCDLATTELLRRLDRALNRPGHLVPVPMSWISFSVRLLGKKAAVERLRGSLQVDSSKAMNLRGWLPPVAIDAALAKTAWHYREHQCS